MKGLITKDLYLSWKYYKPYLFISLIFLVGSFWTSKNIFMLIYPLMLIGMIPTGLQSVDESFKWDVYCGTLPCTKKGIVTEKYLMGLLFMLPVSLLIVLCRTLGMALAGEFQWAVLANLMLIAWMMGFVPSAISLPLIFRYGSEKGRIAQYLIIGAVCGLAALFGVRTNGELTAFSGGIGVLLILFLLPMAMYALSWLLSIRFYEKREIR